jgi:hypothetical protein
VSNYVDTKIITYLFIAKFKVQNVIIRIHFSTHMWYNETSKIMHYKYLCCITYKVISAAISIEELGELMDAE